MEKPVQDDRKFVPYLKTKGMKQHQLIHAAFRSGNPNWPSTTGNPSGGGRGNNPPGGGKGK